MGLSSSSTKTKTNETATTTPTIPSYATPAIQGYFGGVTDLQNQLKENPDMFVTPANSNQLAAAAGAKNLGGWSSGLNASSSQAAAAGNTNFAPVATTNAQSAQLGPANQATSASLLDRPITDYLNPVTQQLVDTTLADYDANSAQVRASQQAQAAKSGAFGGSRYGIAQGQTEGELARGRATTDANLRSSAFDRATGLAQSDAGLRQQTNLFNTGAQNDFALTQGGYNQQAGLFNADAANTNNRYNSSLDVQEAQNKLAAAGIVGNNAAQAGSLAQGDVASQLATGNALREIERQNSLAPVTALAAQQSLLDPALLAAISGQTIKSDGTSSTKSSSNIFQSLLSAGAQAGSAAIMASDRRVKRDIELVGKEPDGLGLYRYNYIWDDADQERRSGVMADEVGRLRPWALGPVIAGISTVDYSKLEAV